MKKLLLVAALAFGVVAASAQTTLEGSKFTDNWSIGLKGGAVSPMKPGAGFFEQARGIVGLELRKQITPILGLGVEGEWTVNTSSWSGVKSANVFDHQYVGVFGALNLMNIFGGYAGQPRVFEIEAVAGTGWLHSYYPSYVTADGNTWANKVGLNLNFNLGAAKAWTLALKPAILWNMGGSPELTNMGVSARYDSRAAFVEMEAGITYHFKNSNGTHSFKVARLMDEGLIADLNAQINALRDELAACGANNAALLAQIADLQAQLDNCLRAKKAPCEEVVKGLNNKYYVFFRQSSSTIEPLQQAQIQLVANALEENAGSTVVVKGYASKEGAASFNQKLSQKRADAVKKALVNKYNVAEGRVTATGEGVTEIFNKLGWNRFAECTIKLANEK